MTPIVTPAASKTSIQINCQQTVYDPLKESKVGQASSWGWMFVYRRCKSRIRDDGKCHTTTLPHVVIAVAMAETWAGRNMDLIGAQLTM